MVRVRLTPNQRAQIARLMRKSLRTTRPRIPVSRLRYATKQDFARSNKRKVRSPRAFIRLGKRAPSLMRRTDLIGFDDGTRSWRGHRRS